MRDINRRRNVQIANASPLRTMPAAIPDNPVASIDQDELGRAAFAVAIADLILSSPPKSSLRIGVYGDWGEGKTSVLKFIEGQLRKEGHHAVWLAPWATSTREELVDDLLFKVAAEFGIDVKDLRKKRLLADKAQDIREATQSDLWARLLDSVAGDWVEGRVKSAVEAETKAFFDRVEHQLDRKKLVVFVDDVDRIRPDVVPQVLLTLREVLDHPNFFYVLALAPDIVEKGLEQVHSAWGNRKQFLEKIVELPLNLPEPTDDEWAAFVATQGKKFPPSPLWDAQIDAYLPRNPRKAKLFFRFASSLQRLLSRFQNDEMDWRTLGLSLMLTLEFPDEVQALANDAQALSDLEYGWFTERGEHRKAKKDEPKPFEAYAPKAEAERFLELCRAIRAREIAGRGAYDLRTMLTLATSPPILTWQELEELHRQSEREGFDAVVAWVGNEAATRRARAAAFCRLVLRWRSNALEQAAEEDFADDLRARLNDSEEALQYLREFMQRGLPFGAEEWLALFGQAAHWTHFDRPDYYATVRANERQLLEESVSWVPLEVQVAILANRLQYDPPHRKRAKDFAEMAQRIQARMEANASSAALAAFAEKDGVDRFWGERGNSALKWMLFDPRSAFHQSEAAKMELAKLSRRAVEGDRTTQNNFRTYFRMLTYAAYEGGGSFPIRDSQEILKDAELVSLVWTAAVALPLNPRTMGSLRQDRANVIAAGVSDTAMPLPQWWIALEEELREDDSSAATGDDETGDDEDDP